MIEKLEQLIAALREELQHYGEMLARLDDQQELVMRRSAEAVLQTIPLVQAQSSILSQARAARVEATKRICAQLLLPEDSPLGELLPKVPLDYRPLLQALVEENNELLVRVQQRARQNYFLLARTVESMQHVINSLTLPRHTPVYSGDGQVAPIPMPSPALYEAVC